MTLFADTNWLVAAYFQENDQDRFKIVERFARRQSLPWVTSHIVLLEACNVFAWVSREANSPEWRRLEADLGRRIHVDAMQWDRVRRRTIELFDRYSHKAQIGTFDTALVASALLTGATHFLTFDSKLKALAAAERLKVFPELTEADKTTLAKMRSRGDSS